MNFSFDKKIIIWATVILIIVFLGLNHELNEIKSLSATRELLTLYGYEIGGRYLEGGYYSRQWGLFSLLPIAQYKYQLIITSCLIGFTFFITAKK